jgi:hypothetical protein
MSTRTLGGWAAAFDSAHGLRVGACVQKRQGNGDGAGAQKGAAVEHGAGRGYLACSWEEQEASFVQENAALNRFMDQGPGGRNQRVRMRSTRLSTTSRSANWRLPPVE